MGGTMRVMYAFFLTGLLLTTPAGLYGCGARGVYPIATGSHAPREANPGKKQFTFVVWSNDPAVANAIGGWVQESGEMVLERSRLTDAMNEAKITPRHTTDDSADVLRAGRVVGVDRIIFADVTLRPEGRSAAYVNHYGGSSQSATVYHASVSVRGVAVDTGRVIWSGTAYYPAPVNNPEQAVVTLANTAMNKALCSTEDGYVWNEITGSKKDGCVKK